MRTYQFTNGTELQFKSLGRALEYAHKNNCLIVRVLN